MRYFLIFLVLLTSCAERKEETVTYAILAKDKEHVLPLYLAQLEKQTWPKKQTYLYVRTNDNNDKTAEILKEWLARVGKQYRGIYYNDVSVNNEIRQFKQHEWNGQRLKILGKIRQDSIDWAKAKGSHYFVADCDNFIDANTVEEMVKTNLPMVAPLLRTADPRPYANYHAAIDENGYYAHADHYYDVLHRRVKGLIEMPVIHCTYLVRREVLDQMKYDDGSGRYEYVIFSDNARKQGITQYLDNRKMYGRITFAESAEELAAEPWIHEFQEPGKEAEIAFAEIYSKGIWAKNEKGKGTSGLGSTEENTRPYREFLEKFLKDREIQTVVDAGSGDWEFSQLIDWQGADYTGYDVVESVVRDVQEKFGNEHRRFVHANFLQADLPKADLFICKDVFQHLPTDDVLSFLPKLKNYKYALITNDIGSSNNWDTAAGGYRTLDMTKPPFNLAGQTVLRFRSGGVDKAVLLIHR